jgi:hypothetical protein
MASHAVAVHQIEVAFENSMAELHILHLAAVCMKLNSLRA